MATQPLPNAKWLFGDDFPSIASEEAELSRGLAKNLAPKLDKSKTTYESRDSRYVTTSSNNSSIILKTANIKIFGKGKNFFVPPGLNRGSCETPSVHRTMEEHNFRPCGFTGVNIPFRCVPFQKPPQARLEQEVQNLLEKGAICKVPFCEEGFYSRLFVTSKRDGSMRPIIEMSTLNRFIDTPHFQMENLATVKSLLRQGHFMTKIDLKNACFSVAIHPQSQKFLRFLWQNKAFQFCSLPFGLNIAPSLFTRRMKPVAGFLRKRAFAYSCTWTIRS